MLSKNFLNRLNILPQSTHSVKSNSLRKIPARNAASYDQMLTGNAELGDP